MVFATVYSLYWNRLESMVEQGEFHQVIEWLTGFDEEN